MVASSVQGLVSSSDVAELAAVARRMVAIWHLQYDDFPETVVGGEIQPLFTYAEAVSRFNQHGIAIRPQTARERVWSVLNWLWSGQFPSGRCG